MGDGPDFATVTAPIRHWARLRPDGLAVSDGTRGLTFAALDAAVRQAAGKVTGPAYAWVQPTPCPLSQRGMGNDASGTLAPSRAAGGGGADQLIAFCAIAESGRAGVVADPEWPEALCAAVRAALPAAPFAGGPPRPKSAFYVGFTSGSTGMPKGFVRSHRSWTESFGAALATFGPGVATPILAPGPLSHSLFLFAALLGLWTGAGAHLQARFSPTRCLDLLASGAAGCLIAVPSQLLAIADAAARRGQEPIASVILVLVSGARWDREETPRLRVLFPRARIVEFYGASETSFVAWTESDPALPEACVGQPFRNVELSIRDGLIFVRSPMLFDGYVMGGEEGVIRQGDWVSVRDMGHLDARGWLFLLGRERRMIVTGGRNVFPEEIEAVLERHPSVAAASVSGLPDRLRGQVLVASVQPRGGAAVDTAALAAHCRATLPDWKVPRRFAIRSDWPRTPSGKTDHGALRTS